MKFKKLVAHLNRKSKAKLNDGGKLSKGGTFVIIQSENTIFQNFECMKNFQNLKKMFILKTK